MKLTLDLYLFANELRNTVLKLQYFKYKWYKYLCGHLSDREYGKFYEEQYKIVYQIFYTLAYLLEVTDVNMFLNTLYKINNKYKHGDKAIRVIMYLIKRGCKV